MCHIVVVAFTFPFWVRFQEANVSQGLVPPPRTDWRVKSWGMKFYPGLSLLKTGLVLGSISAVSRVRSNAGSFSLIVFPNTSGWYWSLVWTVRLIRGQHNWTFYFNLDDVQSRVSGREHFSKNFPHPGTNFQTCQTFWVSASGPSWTTD